MSSPADEIQTMIERGDEALALDDIATARAHYLQAFRDVDHRRRSGVVARMGFLGPFPPKGAA